MFHEAYAAHREGRLEDAERGYRATLQTEPEHVDALHLLGVLHHQQGRNDEALALIGRAAELRPRDAGIQLNLGNVLKALGRVDAAIERFRNTLHVQSDFPLAHYNLGNAYAQAERHAEAADSFASALRLQPGHAAAYNNLGISLNALGRHQEAVDALTEALRLQPGYAGAHNNLGIALNALARPAEALSQFLAATAAEPTFTSAYFNLGNSLDILNRPAEALNAFASALRLQPRFASAHFGLGTTLAVLARHTEAIACFERVVGLDATFSLAWLALGNAHHACGHYEAALRAFDHALRLAPTLAAAHYNRALTLLVRGDFRRGLEEYEWRLRVSASAEVIPVPRWQPNVSLSGRTLLLHAEQGFGDTLQFVRWVPALAQRARHVVLEVQPELLALLAPAAAAWGVELIAQGAKRPAFDCHCPLLSLPRAVGATHLSNPAATPYLSVPDGARARWRDALPRAARRRIGLVWSGRVAARGETRALPLAALAPLFELEVDWIALQPDYETADRAWLAQHQPATLHLLGEQLGDFADTAAVLEQLDAVVSIDSAVAHLAGALGRPCWVMLAFVPDWRWFLDTGSSPWYPSARLVRQPALGDWGSVVERLRDALANPSSVLK